MSQRKHSAFIALAIAVSAVLLWTVLPDSSESPSPGHPKQPTSTADSRKGSPAADHSDVIAPSQRAQSRLEAPSSGNADQQDESGHSRLSDALHSPTHTGMQDLTIVMNLFDQYRKRFRGFPSGEDNAAFVRALSGSNPARIALLNPTHLAIDAKGQLLDRWGKPFFFHLMGSDALEIRSSGPDGEIYTADDQLLASPGLRETASSVAN